jgi:hypothetical protein
MKIGIDLLWVRVGIVGGTESFIRNLMDGFGTYDTENEYILFTARDNAESFRCYENFPHMHLAVMPIDCANQMKRILWENIHLDRIAASYDVDVMFIPVYSKPRSRKDRLPYVCAILDLQALHYPAYFSRIRRAFLRYSWNHTCRTADQVITISNYCKDDLCSHYPNVKDNIQTIYVPITSTMPTKPSTISSTKPSTTPPTPSHAIPRNNYYCNTAAKIPSGTSASPYKHWICRGFIFRKKCCNFTLLQHFFDLSI